MKETMSTAEELRQLWLSVNSARALLERYIARTGTSNHLLRMALQELDDAAHGTYPMGSSEGLSIQPGGFFSRRLMNEGGS